MEGKLDKATEGVVDAQKTLPGLVENLQGMLDQKNGVNQRMFDALHEELKGYKDGFLLEIGAEAGDLRSHLALR